MVFCFDVGLTLLGPGCLGLAYGRFLGLYSCARDVGLLFGFVCFPGLWGFAWLFCWLCPYVGVGFCFSGLIGCLCWLCPYVGD